MSWQWVICVIFPEIWGKTCFVFASPLMLLNLSASFSCFPCWSHYCASQIMSLGMAQNAERQDTPLVQVDTPCSWPIPKRHKVNAPLSVRRYRSMGSLSCPQTLRHLWKLSVGQRHHTQRLPMLGEWFQRLVPYQSEELWFQFLISTWWILVADNCYL